MPYVARGLKYARVFLRPRSLIIAPHEAPGSVRRFETVPSPASSEPNQHYTPNGYRLRFLDGSERRWLRCSGFEYHKYSCTFAPCSRHSYLIEIPTTCNRLGYISWATLVPAPDDRYQSLLRAIQRLQVPLPRLQDVRRPATATAKPIRGFRRQDDHSDSLLGQFDV